MPRAPWTRRARPSDRSADAFEASVATFEKSFDAAGQGAAAFNRKIIDIARRNLNSSFDLAKSLAGAKNLADMVELQMAYWQKQFGALTAQAEEVHALSTKLTVDTAEPIKALAARKHGYCEGTLIGRGPPFTRAPDGSAWRLRPGQSARTRRLDHLALGWVRGF